MNENLTCWLFGIISVCGGVEFVRSRIGSASSTYGSLAPIVSTRIDCFGQATTSRSGRQSLNRCPLLSLFKFSLPAPNSTLRLLSTSSNFNSTSVGFSGFFLHSLFSIFVFVLKLQVLSPRPPGAGFDSAFFRLEFGRWRPAAYISRSLQVAHHCIPPLASELSDSERHRIVVVVSCQCHRNAVATDASRYSTFQTRSIEESIIPGDVVFNFWGP